MRGESTSIQAFGYTLTSSSYAVCDSAWCYQYDKYTDNFCYVQVVHIQQVLWQELIEIEMHGSHRLRL